MNRSKLFSALAAASLLVPAAAMAQGAKPAKPTTPTTHAAVTAAATADTTKKKPLPTPKHKSKKVKPSAKPDSTKKPN